MNDKKPPLPNFKNPPVIEVALSAQFNPISSFRTLHIGLLWNSFKKDFPKFEEHQPRESVFENFDIPGPPKIEIQYQSKLPVPKVWFLNTAGTELIQIQSDRFVHNWRKTGKGENYPRYEYIQKKFRRELDAFCQFLLNEGLGKLIPNQCEVTYVNHIVAGRGWERHGQAHQVFPVFSGKFSDSFLSEPENVRFVEKHIMRNKDGKPMGRLHIKIETAFLNGGKTPIFVLTITARGAPENQEIDSVIQFMDMGREWVVRGFASMTSKSMHEIWGRDDGN